MAFVFLIRLDQTLGSEQQPAGMYGCWKLNVPDGQTWPQAAAEFAQHSGFPVGAVASVVDPSVAGAMQSFKLEQQWVPYSE